MGYNDYYQILGIDPGASEQDIKAAYRKGALMYHPDRNRNNPEASEKMKALNEAYAVLSDRTKRSDYDSLRRRFGDDAYGRFRQSRSQQDIFSGSDIQSIFEELSRAFGLRGFDELFTQRGGTGVHTFTFGNQGMSGTGYVFTGAFEPDRNPERGSPSLQSRAAVKMAGRLLKKMTGIDLPIMGNDIHDSLHITPEQAKLGGNIHYFVKKRGKKLAIRIPSELQDGQQIRLAAMGEDGTGGAPPGHLYLTVRIKKPLLRRAASFISSFMK